MEKIKVLVVDDSVFMRMAISKILNCNEIEVIGTAKNGKEGYEQAINLKPDVITMDIEMPVMTGIESLKLIMDTFPLPVIMVSTLTSDGADSTIEALSLGAVDFINKKSNLLEMDSIREELITKVKEVYHNSYLHNQMTRMRLLNRSKSRTQKFSQPIGNNFSKNSFINIASKYTSKKIKIICIGISTGGPNALLQVIPFIPKTFNIPIIVVQHMPPYFTNSLAVRLNNLSQLSVKESESGDLLSPGFVYIAKGGKQLLCNSSYKLLISDEPSNSLFKPSIDITMLSLVDIFGGSILGIMMTGMGKDGLNGFNKLHSKGGLIFAQDITTCTISSMPNAVINAGIVDEIVPLEQIANSMISLI